MQGSNRKEFFMGKSPSIIGSKLLISFSLAAVLRSCKKEEERRKEGRRERRKEERKEGKE